MSATHAMGIPLTVVGGFLGAGKTTLLNRLLRTADGRKLALMVNDFGAINIDAELVESREGETISLTNGCICCGLSGEFMFALAGLRDREDPPEHVIVEASGVGDTNSILAYGDMPGFAQDAALVVVDTETVRARAQDPATGPQVLGQLRSADLVVLNKTDLVTAAEHEATRAWVRGIVGPSTAIVAASFGDVPTDVLLGARDATRGAVPAAAAAPDDHHEHELEHADYETWSWEGDATLHGAGLVDVLNALPEGILRGKGFLRLREDPGNRYRLQLVGRRYAIRRDRPWGDEAPRSRLVLIGLPGSIHAEELDVTLARLSAPVEARAQ